MTNYIRIMLGMQFFFMFVFWCAPIARKRFKNMQGFKMLTLYYQVNSASSKLLDNIAQLFSLSFISHHKSLSA